MEKYIPAPNRTRKETSTALTVFWDIPRRALKINNDNAIKSINARMINIRLLAPETRIATKPLIRLKFTQKNNLNVFSVVLNNNTTAKYNCIRPMAEYRSALTNTEGYLVKIP
jgi:hypothetical protein